jgi:hypothetical protein
MDSPRCQSCGRKCSRRSAYCAKCVGRYLDGHEDGAAIVSGPSSISSEQAVENVKGTHLKFLLWPDTHFPYHDEKAIGLGLKVVRYYQPDIIYLLGDMLDCTGFGRFKHKLTDPRTFLKNELALFRDFAQRLNDTSPKSTKFYIEGNHEARVEKWTWDHPQLDELEEMELNSLLWLDKFGYSNHGKMIMECELADGQLTFTHGTHTGSNKAGFAARAEMARYGTSGGSGHTHRIAKYMERSKRGLRVWVEAGHMSAHQPHYLKALPNWQQGLVIGQAATNGNDFEMEEVPFRLSYKCRIYGKELAA